jgi:S1-C subfamily serine protease
MPSPKEILDKVGCNLHHIVQDNRAGTGFRVNKSWLATCFHVVPTKSPIGIDGKAPTPCEKKDHSEDDLAFVRYPNMTAAPTIRFGKKPKVGDNVHLLSLNPQGTQYFSHGSVKYVSDEAICATYASIPGTSGGIVVNDACELIGMHQAGAAGVASFLLPAAKIQKHYIADGMAAPRFPNAAR